jgi:MFS family permease
MFFAVFSLVGLGLATANYWALTQTLAPGAALGRIAGLQNCASNLSGIAASLLTGWLKQASGNYEAPMQFMWVVLVAGVAAYTFMVRTPLRPPKLPDPSPAIR